MSQALTDERFWDEYWSAIQLPALVDERVQWQGALAGIFRKHLPRGNDRTLLEIGCAPGRWLIWFAKHLGYRIAGSELSRSAAAVTRQNLAMNDVEGEIHCGNVLTDAALDGKQFDVVLSLGLIEHFDQPETIIRRHVSLLKPGGYLVLEVPNFAGSLNHFLLRRARLKSFIAAHNLAVMNEPFFANVAAGHGLEIVHLGYAGGFDPGIVVYNQAYPRWRRPLAVHALAVLEKITSRIPRIMRRLNHRAFSQMLIAIYRKRPATSPD